jgi:hypothetical protein
MLLVYHYVIAGTKVPNELAIHQNEILIHQTNYRPSKSIYECIESTKK